MTDQRYGSESTIRSQEDAYLAHRFGDVDHMRRQMWSNGDIFPTQGSVLSIGLSKAGKVSSRRLGQLMDAFSY